MLVANNILHDISIHALREEGDLFKTGERLLHKISIHALREEGDPMRRDALCLVLISIHALREEGDASTLTLVSPKLNFYPRPPRGGRRVGVARLGDRLIISIHALREEGDARFLAANGTRE